ncbi:MAG: RNA polymerase subunit sigma-24 [Paenibacillaceae bacterium]|nr:RNA polymerase subunit sigma-24 [Paenibacillaceae bacterium]
MAAETSSVERRVIEQLMGYRDLAGRIRVLSSQSVGAGMTVSRISEDDQLQELHRKLRGMPSYMYLNKHEQKLEQTAHAYLTYYPVGTRAQKRAVPMCGVDAEDDKLLREIREKIQKVIDSRGGCSTDLDELLERVAELQDLQEEKAKIDQVLEILGESHSHLSELLRHYYLEGKSWREVINVMGISKSVFYRWKPVAIGKYAKLIGWE